MAGRVTKTMAARRNSLRNSLEFRYSDQGSTSSTDVELEFLNDELLLTEEINSVDCLHNELVNDETDDEGRENNGSVEEDKSYWENQHQLLQNTLYRTSSLESGIRNATKEALREIQSAETVCACGRPMAASCRNCLIREISGRLQIAGYNSAICKSKWRSSPDSPSGEHTFLDVIENTRSKKGEMRVIIELNFKAEFEMARANEEYNRLVQRLPEVFVGKIERLQGLIKILCMAAKKCMKEKKMHLGPWRKQKYMQAKWLSACERTSSTSLLSTTYSGRTAKAKGINAHS
ncbi:Protein of unknown function (DUF506) [Quillaja saponaria]|uniref:Uncharacterized protein n=1 Tax=Quillaja saponaria TaxID=32244 RepID=A0AAD7M259_QUISA|nr:Protein of unknown function (DUF506) [Quillaja saponaria]